MTGVVPVAECIRIQRLEAMLDAISTWQRAHGPARSRARCDAADAIHEFKRRHLEPERLAFEAAVRRRKAA